MFFDKAKQAFEKYVDKFDRKDKNISLKYKHTYKVVELMAELAFRLNLTKEEIELAKLIGLLHDIGRFEQIKQFNTFKDKASFDHAKEACVYLFDDGHIRDFIDDDKYDDVIRNAVFNHNKLDIETMDEKSLLFVRMIRDMDKVDIFRTLATDFDMKFKADDVTEEVLKEYSNKKLIDREIIKSDSDSTLLYLSYVFDFNFDDSFDILVETDNFDFFLSMVEVEANSEKLWKKVREISFDKINQGIGD